MASTATETWLNVTDAARAIGEHRGQLARMLKAGKLPKRLIRDTSPPMLRLEGLAEAVRKGKRIRVDSKQAPPLKPQPPPDPVTQAQQQVARIAAQAQEAQDREGQILAAYHPFRDWIAGGFTLELWQALGDGPLEIGAVMTTARQLLINRLSELDRIDIQARASRSVRRSCSGS